MKITTFNPMIITKNAESAVDLFEELGFQKRHTPVAETETGDVTSYRLKDENGFYIDVADVNTIPQDKMYIRMNVDDYEEAYDILIKHGFTNTRGDESIETGHAKAATMVSPSGFIISLVKHMKSE